MKIKTNKFCCSNPKCDCYMKFGLGNIGKHSFYPTKKGKKRRLCCKICDTTFSTSKGTVYYRLQKSKSDFDEVISMSVEGQSGSSIARVKKISRNTVANWRLKASVRASKFQKKHLKGYDIKELQFDEMKIFLNGKKEEKWIFTSMEVSSRLWPATVIGRRSYKNTNSIINNTICRGKIDGRILVNTDGFEPYKYRIKALIGVACVYAQVIKTIRKNRVVCVDRRYIIGDQKKFEEQLFFSEDSNTVNTSFIERQNLTIRHLHTFQEKLYAMQERNIFLKLI